MRTVVVTDPGFPHSISAVRSLARAGFRVATVGFGESKVADYGCFSRYCSAYRRMRKTDSREVIIQQLVDFAQQQRAAAVLPISFFANVLFSRHIDTFERAGIKVLVTAWQDGMQTAASKVSSFRFAKKIGVPIPRTQFLDRDDQGPFSCDLTFPLVLKGPDGLGARYVNRPSQLRYQVDQFWRQTSEPEILVQEYVRGDGYGYFALCREGEILCQFMHHRIREYPITGGPSVLAESFHHRRLEELGRRVLSHLKWNGVAMVEFKRDVRDDEFRLMEINPKFWGSLELAIKSGVDFPVYAVQTALGDSFQPVMNFSNNTVCHWPFRGELALIAGFPGELRTVLGVLFDRRMRNTWNIELGDPVPTVVELFRELGAIVKRAIHGELRYPNGRPGC